MTELTRSTSETESQTLGLAENLAFSKCPICGDRLCPHGICRKAEPEYACKVCFCSDCGADLCLHGHCQNYCDLGGDGPCPECYEQMCLEVEAEIEASWQKNIMGPMLGFGERTANDDADDITEYLDDQRRKEAGFE